MEEEREETSVKTTRQLTQLQRITRRFFFDVAIYINNYN